MPISELFAFIPYYDSQGGNHTYIIKKDGSKEYFPCRLKSYIYKMFSALHIDRKSRKAWITQCILDKSNHPLVINEDLIFIPIKLRKGVASQDGCYAYVHWQAIKHLTKQGIMLHNGITIPCRCNVAYIEKKQKDALLLKYLYIDHHKEPCFIYPT